MEGGAFDVWLQVILWMDKWEDAYRFLVAQNNKWELDGRGKVAGRS